VPLPTREVAAARRSPAPHAPKLLLPAVPVADFHRQNGARPVPATSSLAGDNRAPASRSAR
jgi:hypothetical protein